MICSSFCEVNCSILLFTGLPGREHSGVCRWDDGLGAMRLLHRYTPGATRDCAARRMYVGIEGDGYVVGCAGGMNPSRVAYIVRRRL